MKITVKGYITCKEAENYSDCADNYAYNTETNRFAISDGVTKSFFPKIWSQILVDNFVALQGAAELSIEKCQSEWLKQVAERVNALDVKWFTKNAFIQQKSGLATFASLYFDKNQWFGKALGDSFLFFVPKGKEGFDNWIKLSSKSEPVVFDSFPDYYSSRGNANGEAKSREGKLEAGTFYLMTDALSEWVFNEKENALKEIQEKWVSQSEFERSVNELRALQSLNNDDSSVLIIEVENDGKSQFQYEPANVQDIKFLIAQEQAEQPEEKKEEAFITEARERQKEQEFTEIASTDALEESEEQTNLAEESLSPNAQAVFEECVKMYSEMVKLIESRIKEGNIPTTNKWKNVFKRLFNNKKPKSISEEEQQLVIKKLKEEYGISFKN